MHVIQLVTGILFSILTAIGVYFYYEKENNVFLAASALFFLIALSCLILATVRIRKKRRKSKKNATALQNEIIESRKKIENTPEIEETPIETASIETASEEEKAEEYSFSREYEPDLSRMEEELYLTNNQANVTGRNLELMTRDELEIAMQRTQIAINSFTRLKMFCESKGLDGREFYEQRLQQYSEKEELLSSDELSAQMSTLRHALENRDKNMDDPSSRQVDEQNLDARILQIVADNDGIRPNAVLACFDTALRKSVKKEVRKLISEGKLIRERDGSRNLLHAALEEDGKTASAPAPEEMESASEPTETAPASGISDQADETENKSVSIDTADEQ